MKTTFLEYYKMILEKVSFDRKLWRKEYQKALQCLPSTDVRHLNEWVSQKRWPH